MKHWRCVGLLLLGSVCLTVQALDGVVRDASTGRPIALATLVAGDALARSDALGRFDFGAGVHATRILARAPGYARLERAVQGAEPLALTLTALRPKAIYLTPYGLGSATLRGDALKLIDDTELNALVIDIKGDRGLVPFRSASLVAAGLPQTVVTVSDMPALMKTLRARLVPDRAHRGIQGRAAGNGPSAVDGA